MGVGVLRFCVVEDMCAPSNPTCEEKSEVKFDVPSSSLTLSGIFCNARAMFSGAACIVLCLLPDFWTLPGAGDEVETMDGGGDWVDSLVSIGTLYSGRHRHDEPRQVSTTQTHV